MNMQSKVETRGIVRGGETLKQHRDRLMEATKLTGHYAGIKKLELRDSQPILYNKLFSRLRAGVVDARETAKNGKFYFNLKAGNHQIIGTSEMYESEGSRENGIAAVKTAAYSAELDDTTA